MARESTQRCAACLGVFAINGHKRNPFTTHACPALGTDALNSGWEWAACPTHGTLVWALGPYSAYPVCGAGKACTSGKPTKEGYPRPWCYRVSKSYDGTPTPVGKDSRPLPDSHDAPSPIDVIDVDSPEVTPTPVTTKATPVIKSTTPVSFTALDTLGTLGDAIKGYVDVRAREIASEIAVEAYESLGGGKSHTIDWTVNGTPFATIEGTHHKALPRMLKLYAAGFKNFLIVGPAGSGKTTLAANLAASLALSFASVACTAGMSETALTGRAIPNLATGETVYQSTDFVRSYEAGGVFLIDELDAADPNVMLVINSALANGHMPLPNRVGTPSASRHDQAIVVCAANTWGNGADRQYVGRNQLDAAFLDRFVGATLAVGYDRDLEASLIGDAHICARVWEIRSKVDDLKLRKIVGTRFLMSVTRLVKSAGETLTTALLACTEGWTTDERTKVGIAVSS